MDDPVLRRAGLSRSGRVREELAITFIERSRTPVLNLQGERDEEVPAPQDFEFWHPMETLGVPSKLVVYADEGHSPQKIGSQIDILTQTVDWFNQYLR